MKALAPELMGDRETIPPRVFFEMMREMDVVGYRIELAASAHDKLEKVLEREVAAAAQVRAGVEALEAELAPLLGRALKGLWVQPAREGAVPQRFERKQVTRVAVVEGLQCLAAQKASSAAEGSKVDDGAESRGTWT